MENPSYLITVEDHDGVAWEIDLYNETSIERLQAARSIISDKAVIIKEQMDKNPEPSEWLHKARFSRKIAERNVVQIDRRIKQINDPKGIEGFKRNRFQFYMGRLRGDFDFFIEYLIENNPEILNEIISNLEKHGGKSEKFEHRLLTHD